MPTTEAKPARKHHRHRHQSDRSVVQYLVLVFCIGLAVACVVGLILLLNSRIFVEPR